MADRLIIIKSCLSCPHHRFESDPSSHDSFDMMDDSLVCSAVTPTEQELKYRIRYDKPPGTIICGPDRSAQNSYIRAGQVIPDWCPLPKAEGCPFQKGEK